ncbi:polysaccharide pyruvyl transferase family protein [Aestuariibacter halophilus]|uniref:Polysaccharide pyruvyl transferase family protein n=1 Tax=Fluctibacter halophilus TaxID=226011 RepID=A0ABS8GBH9_9ALTE|nr:polysaccharide pyruvyl transferase family protein [Aestuariibacter halophilus]MCC2616576.1 polysaccharide pyruvyl transferase family protein [Aestuariibacter halophilus]
MPSMDNGAKPNRADSPVGAWFWSALLGPMWPLNPEVCLLSGAQQLTRAGLSANALNVVFGAGIGADPPTKEILLQQAHVYGVRGPLSAQMLGLPATKVLADPAGLLPQILPKPVIPSSRQSVVFVPSHRGRDSVNWQRICQRAGITHVDPGLTPTSFVHVIAGARLVLAESLQAVVIADAYRVPWIPVWSRHDIHRFAWNDWALSVGADVLPEALPPPSRLARLDNLFTRFSVFNSRRLRGSDFNRGIDVQACVADFNRQLRLRRKPAYRVIREGYRLLRRWVLRPLFAVLGNQPEGYTRRLSERLERLSQQPGYLSDQQTFEQSQQRLLMGLAVLKSSSRLGFKDIDVERRHEA